ncbi:MAG: antitoxin MazE family protein [Alphaproteobacteria bacterium]|jgi:DNA-binding LacI/PurR family transcriptional regulator|nr:antitoxin MazE family protein [Alphaproteobacteria bacterium]MBU2043139.1 antitoxin MazE family protein [Alphaproteobacteria bacterium]MBU2124469.1 antitoxin MazE family protein [Alphaproteobacteria bacterium]MBU2207681.1 antitoxin MazE family protein [Alphaproteobacteria bacterium]MBU2290214.1 antitoxin MazE family protein [Alphaproteobacteria bacterium]
MASSAKRVSGYRDRLRAQGLRPVQIWVPETRAPGYDERIRRQCLALRDSPDEALVLAELELLADRDGWT